ncbi:MAG: hypothetical protein AAFR27_08195, partial [Pseudomonadota bacterium]
MSRTAPRNIDPWKQALIGLLLVAFWSGPLVHRSHAGEPDLTRLVEFVKYVTPDGQLPDLCIGGSAESDHFGFHLCDACVANVMGALDTPKVTSVANRASLSRNWLSDASQITQKKSAYRSF